MYSVCKFESSVLSEVLKVILQTESEIKQGKSPSRFDMFIKSLEENRDYYKCETENLLKPYITLFFKGVSFDPKVFKTLREREELTSKLKKYEHHVAEILGNLQVLTAERGKIVNLYEQISQETAFNQKAHLEQRIEELETTIHNSNSERLEQMSKVALIKDTIDSLETEMKRLTRKVLDSETDLLKEKTEQSLSETQQSLIKKKHEMKLSQEKIMLLDEKIGEMLQSLSHLNGLSLDSLQCVHVSLILGRPELDPALQMCLIRGNFSRQSHVQEEICAQLDMEKASLQDCVEERREKIDTFEESLAIKLLTFI
ncbi:hypothetical protein BTVI_135130 [Pitangus sulphuratus]|nr:hypothetical protein BTVI_135130 [Pitangus sulphuratus]